MTTKGMVSPIKLTSYGIVGISFLLTTLALQFHIRHSLYVVIGWHGLVFAVYTLRKTEEARMSTYLSLAFLFGAGFLIFFSGLASMLGLLITKWILLSLPITVLGLVISSPLEWADLGLKFSREDWIPLLLLALAVGSRVVSVRGFSAPILHDPISHATWAKQIADTGQINYFYSPGLHILAALGKLTDGVNTPNYILRLTNIFNALCFLPVYYLFRKLSKSLIGGAIAAAIFLIAPLPTNFFWTAGKNGLVTALPFLLLLLYLLATEMPYWRKFIVTNIVVFVLILAHYPAAAIGLIGAFSLIVTSMKVKDLGHLAVGCILGVIWGVLKYRFEVELRTESVAQTLPAIALSGTNLYLFLIDLLNQAVGFLSNLPLRLFGGIGFAGLLLMGVDRTAKNFRWVAVFFFLNLLVAYVVNFTPLRSPLTLVYSTQILTLFIFIYLGAAYILMKILEVPTLPTPMLQPVVIGLVLVTVVASSVNVYQTYRRKQTNLNAVSINDLEAYQWLDKELNDGIILNNAAQNERAFIVFASDGGAWIPAFTDSEIAMPFTEFSSEETHENYQDYLALVEDPHSCEAIGDLVSKDIHYYYKDSQGVFGPVFDPAGNPENFKPIYAMDGIEIFEIVPCAP